MSRLNALTDRIAGQVFGLTNYNNLEADVNYLVVAGAALAALGASNTLAITAEFHHVTLAAGNTIDNLSDTLGASAGQQVRLWFDNAQTIRNNGGGTGNIRTLSGNNLAMHANDVIIFVYDGTYWREQRQTNFAGARVNHSGVGSQTIATGTGTDVVYDQALIDTYGMWSAGSPTLLTAKEAGIYVVGANGYFGADAAGTQRELALLVNGATVARDHQEPTATSCWLGCSTLVQLAVGDAIKAQVYHDAGHNLGWFADPTDAPNLWAAKVGG